MWRFRTKWWLLLHCETAEDQLCCCSDVLRTKRFFAGWSPLPAWLVFILPLPPVIEAISPVFLVLSCKFIGVFLSLSSENQERHQARHVLWSQRKDSQHSRLHVAQTGTRWPWSAAMPAYRLSAKTERHLSAAAVADKEFKAKACVCTVLFMHTRIKSTQSVTQLLHYTITRVRNN